MSGHLVPGEGPAGDEALPVGSHFFLHSSAVVDDDVCIGAGTRIWHFSHLMSRCRIGAGCNIGQNVVIERGVQVGDGCRLMNNVTLCERVTLEEDVFCGPSMVFTNVINPRAHISRKHEFLPTLVRRGCTIGANATIVCGRVLGRYSFIGAGAVVTRDVPDHAIVVGNPARRTGWVCQCGVKLGMDLACPVCALRYRMREDAGGLSPLDAPSS